MRQSNIHKIGLLLKNPKQVLLGNSLLTSLNYVGLPLNNYDEFIKKWKELDVLMIDEAHAKQSLHKINDLIKQRAHPLLIILVLEKEKNIGQWLEVDIHDIIQAPIEKIDLMLALNRIAKLKKQIESRLEDLRKFSEHILNQTKENWTKENYKKLLEYSPYGILIESDGKIVYANESMMKILGVVHEQQLKNYEFSLLFNDSTRGQMNKKLKMTKKEKKIIEMLDEKLIRFDKTEVAVEILASPFIFENKPSLQMIVNDISKRRAAEHELAYLAYHDGLTGLANRSMLENIMSQNIILSKRKNEKFATLFLDLDHFKMVNDTLGHLRGDLLLKEVANRLLSNLRKSDLVARIGGDEFILILGGVLKIESAGVIAEKIIKLFKNPFIVDKNEVFITASIGISLFPDNGEDVSSLLKNSDIAMYRAKELGRNNYQFCTNELTVQLQERASLENNLHQAIKENQLLLHYQPIYEIKTQKITGIEALLRWQHPKKGLIYPLEFMELAEETGMITPIAEWVIERACEDNKIWKKAKIPPLTLSINLSVSDLKKRNFVDDIKRIIKKTKIDSHYLEFEITESRIMENVENTISIFKQFKEMGIHIAVDDFGIGYSSLSYLKKFNIDRLKIDKTFIHDVSKDPNDAGIVAAIIAMSHSLKMCVIAEGVETKEQLAFLKKQKCDEVQGNFFCKALPAKELLEFLINQKPN